MHIIYRLSDNGYNKPKFPNATKIHCLENCITSFLSETTYHLFVDKTNLTESTKDYIDKSLTWKHKWWEHFEYYVGGSSAESWRYVFKYAIENFKDEEIIYFLEDDYLHTQFYKGRFAIEEGLEIADYVSLYDHNDKYIPASKGGNPYIGEDGGEVTKIYRTKSTHWKLTNSTTMTFATTAKQLRDDVHVWTEYTTGTHPNDFGCFIKLRELGRSLITPIPGLSTHCEPQWASPGIDWERV